jgi:hypothetical protein
MTLNWEGGFQYGGAITADGLADAAAAFPTMPGASRWLEELDRVLDTYLQPPSPPQLVPCGTHFPYGAANASMSCAYTLFHNATLPPTDLAALEATVGDHLGLFPVAYLARARRRGPAHPGAAADLEVAKVTAERYIVGFPHRVPLGLPAAGTFARTGGDPRENSTGAATFLCKRSDYPMRLIPGTSDWHFGVRTGGDDQFMGLTLLCRLATGTELDRAVRGSYATLAAKMQLAFSAEMRDPADGLYAHGVNVANGHHSCCKWGRANGWGMLSHVEVLSALVAFPGHPLTAQVRPGSQMKTTQSSAFGLTRGNLLRRCSLTTVEGW